MSESAENRPLATVRVIHRPDFGPQAVEIEVICPARVTSVTATSRGYLPAEERVASLLVTVCEEHDVRCGACDLSEVYQQGQVDLRVAPPKAWRVRREIQRQRRLIGQWM